MGFSGGSVVKNSPASAGDEGSVPEWGRSPGEGNDNPLLSILAWETTWTEDPGGLQSIRWQRVRHDLVTKQQHSILCTCATFCLFIPPQMDT